SKAPRPPPPSRTPRSGARPARRRSPCRRRAWWRPCARCWRGTEVDADGKGGTYTIAPVGARVAIVQSVGLFDDGQALIEHVLYPGFEMRKTTPLIRASRCCSIRRVKSAVCSASVRTSATSRRRALVSVKFSRTSLASRVRSTSSAMRESCHGAALGAIPARHRLRVLDSTMPAEAARRVDALEAQAQRLMATFARAGYEQIAPAIIQPAGLFLDVVGEALRARTYVFTD